MSLPSEVFCSCVHLCDPANPVNVMIRAITQGLRETGAEVHRKSSCTTIDGLLQALS